MAHHLAAHVHVELGEFAATNQFIIGVVAHKEPIRLLGQVHGLKLIGGVNIIVKVDNELVILVLLSLIEGVLLLLGQTRRPCLIGVLIIHCPVGLVLSNLPLPHHYVYVFFVLSIITIFLHQSLVLVRNSPTGRGLL